VQARTGLSDSARGQDVADANQRHGNWDAAGVIDDYNIGDHAASGNSAISGPRCRLYSQLIDPRSTFVRTAGAGSGIPAAAAMMLATGVRSELKGTEG
jgi:hypothetical protein